jgi:hypothetical protein
MTKDATMNRDHISERKPICWGPLAELASDLDRPAIIQYNASTALKLNVFHIKQKRDKMNLRYNTHNFMYKWIDLSA